MEQTQLYVALYDAIIENNYIIVNQFLNEGINLYTPLLYGYSALYWSILKGNLKIIKLIINKNYIPTDNEVRIAKLKHNNNLYQLILDGINKNLTFEIEI